MRIGSNKRVKASMVIPDDKPELKNMNKSPSDNNMDCLKLDSAMSPRTNASTSGATGYLSFFMA